MRDDGTQSAQTDGQERLANVLGWFSIGLGLAQVIAPRRVARMIGVNDDGESSALMRTLGLREIASGVGILSRERPARWVWTRVAGDAMDLALLTSAMSSDDARKSRVAAATAAVLGVTALDVLVGTQLSRDDATTQRRPASQKKLLPVRAAITIGQPIEVVYTFWRALENLPRFMNNLDEVTEIDERRSRWTAKAPAGTTVQWMAEIVNDRLNELIEWRSLPDSDVYNEGSVRFRRAPGDRGTEVHVELQWAPPGGKIGATVAKLFGQDPGQQLEKDLRHLKQVLETGEIVHSDASIANGPHPARPAATLE
jgi:uncharacterized membrane protein